MYIAKEYVSKNVGWDNTKHTNTLFGKSIANSIEWNVEKFIFWAVTSVEWQRQLARMRWKVKNSISSSETTTQRKNSITTIVFYEIQFEHNKHQKLLTINLLA